VYFSTFSFACSLIVAGVISTAGGINN
jgi:hypothetical protein